MEMGRQTEALVQFHHCLKLQTDFAPAKCQIKKVSLSDVYMCQNPVLHPDLWVMAVLEPSTLAWHMKYKLNKDAAIFVVKNVSDYYYYYSLQSYKYYKG